MIDTVHLRNLVPPSLPLGDLLSRAPFETRCGHTPAAGESSTYVLNLPRDDAVTLPQLTVSTTASGVWCTAALSVPKHLYGNNVVMVSDADMTRALASVSRFVTQICGFEFDAHHALVGRADYCYNFATGEANVAAYIDAGAVATVPRADRFKINSTTVSFVTKGKVIKLYGKYAEVSAQRREGKATGDELRAAEGKTRLEVTHRRRDALMRLAERHGLEDRRAHQLLTADVAHSELGRALGLLGLDKPTRPLDTRMDILREKYGDTKRCRSLAAFLYYLDRYGEATWRRDEGGRYPAWYGYSRSTYMANVRLLRDAGAWVRADRQLPPLVLVWPEGRAARVS
jgi:hypothetical protein